MKRLATLILASVFLSLPILPLGYVAFAHADVALYSWSVACDPATTQASFRPAVSFDQGDPEKATAECVLKDGTSILVKLMAFPIMPYGSGSPVGLISVWMNKSKVLSKISFDCRNDDTLCDSMIKVTAKGLSLCEQDQTHRKAPNWRCSFTPKNKLSKKRDNVEYPLTDQRQPPLVGTVVTFYEKEKLFCELFGKQGSQNEFKDEFPSYLLPPTGYESVGDPGAINEYTFIHFDANNDGQEDNILVRHARSHPEDSDTFYLYGSQRIPEEPQDLTTDSRESFYRLSAARIFPDSWGTWTKLAKAPWWDPLDKPEFRPQYLYLWPFRWQSVTYFMTGSAELNKAHWHLILRPEQNYSSTAMCVFQIVRERY